MRSRTPPSRSLCLLALIGLAWASGPLCAQRLEDGSNELEKKGRRTYRLRADLFNGKATADPKDKDHVEAVEVAAKEVTYYLYWDSVTRPAQGKMAGYVDTFDSRLQQMTKYKAATEVFQQMYVRQVVERAAEVIQRGKPIACVNAARILALIPERRMERGVLQADKAWVSEVAPRLAEGNGEYLAETCLTLLNDPRANQGVKYYLFHTLASLVRLPKQNPQLLKKETEEKAVLAAMKFVDKPVPFPRATPRGEVEGYKVLRGEAVKVVAASSVPLLADKQRPAWTLAKVAGADKGVVPAPRLDERIEAAIGLARMTAASAKSADLEPAYASLQVARAVLLFADLANKNTTTDNKPSTRARPWKVDAARLGEAIEELKATAKDPYTQGVVKEMLPVLAEIEKGAQGQSQNLGDWLTRNECPAKTLFKGAPETTVTPLATEK
jgi:hypothetical protein